MVPGRCLVVFTKPARPGEVKTRLIGDLTPGQAAELHAAFLGDLLEELGGGAFALRIAWALAADEAIPDLGPIGVRQQGADLGERLYRALASAAGSYSMVAAVGSDHPDLPRARVEEAFALLESDCDVALGPAADGGYYIIALRAPAVRRELFEGVAWSTATVLAATLQRCAALELRIALLAPASDIDTPADLHRLAASLGRGTGGCPRTRELLCRWRLLPENLAQAAG